MLDKIGAIVREARTAQKKDVDVLAREASVEEAIIKGLERGERGVTTTQLARLAGALSLDEVSLLEGKRVDRPRASVFLRHTGRQDFRDADYAALDLAIDRSTSFLAMNDSLGLAQSQRRLGRFAPRAVNYTNATKAAQDGYRLAEEARSVIANSAEPIADIRALVEDVFEVLVLAVPLHTDGSTAVGIRADNHAAAIVLNSIESVKANYPLVARVHIAHELCHILHDPSTARGLHIVLDRTERDAPTERAEQRAKAFAAEFLIPQAGLSALLPRPQRVESPSEARELVAQAREHFCTPWAITAHHLFHRGYISESARDAIVDDRAPKERVQAPGRLPNANEPSIAFADRIRLLHDKGLITDGQARVALTLSIDDRLPWD